MTRAEVREHLFKLVFRLEFADAVELEEQLDRYFADPYKEDTLSTEPEDAERICIFSEKEEIYIRDKFHAILDKKTEIDEMINRNSKGWDVSRIGKVDIAILRLAVYELSFDEAIPTGVAIDQAVELAKKYGRDESASFINGILASIAKAKQE